MESLLYMAKGIVVILGLGLVVITLGISMDFALSQRTQHNRGQDA